MMGMQNPMQAALALDGLALGARVVACGIDDDGTAFGFLMEHRALADGRRFWKDMTGAGVAYSARKVAQEFDDMVIVHLPEPAGSSKEDDHG